MDLLSLKKNKFFDILIYYLSQKKWVYETLIFKSYLFTKNTKKISNFNPIIIGGCPRSGTTLFRSLLGMHTDIVCPEKEFNVLLWIEKTDMLQPAFDFTDKEVKKILEEYKDHISLAESILKSYKTKKKADLIGIKHPWHISIIDNIFKNFPRAKFIHVIRDGRDTVCSLRTHPKRKIVNGKIIPLKTCNPIDYCIRRWVSSINQGKKWRGKQNYLEVKYEDLIYNVVPSMKRVFDFLNLDMISKERILSFYKYEDEFKHPQNIEVGKSIYEKSVGRWKRDLSKKEIKMFKNMAGDLLIQLYYEKNNEW